MLNPLRVQPPSNNEELKDSYFSFDLLKVLNKHLFIPLRGPLGVSLCRPLLSHWFSSGRLICILVPELQCLLQLQNALETSALGRLLIHWREEPRDKAVASAGVVAFFFLHSFFNQDVKTFPPAVDTLK